MAENRTTYEAEITDQRITKSKSGTPILGLKVRLLARYKNGFDSSKGKTPLAEDMRETGEVPIFFDPQDLSRAAKSLAVLGTANGDGVKLSYFSSAHPKFIDLRGRKFPCYVTKTDDKERWYVSDKMKAGSDQEEFDLASIQAWESENSDALKSATEQPAF